MSWRATAIVKDLHTRDGITRSEKLTLMCLADYHNDDTKRCDPSLRRLADDSLLSERQLRNVLRSLEKKGFIRTEFREGASSNYYLSCVDGTPATITGVTPETISGGAEIIAGVPRQRRLRELPGRGEIAIAGEGGNSYCPQTANEPQEEPQASMQAMPSDLSPVEQAFENEIGPATPAVRRGLSAEVASHGEALVLRGISWTRERGARAPMRYLVATLKAWARDGPPVQVAAAGDEGSARSQFMQRSRERRLSASHTDSCCKPVSQEG